MGRSARAESSGAFSSLPTKTELRRSEFPHDAALALICFGSKSTRDPDARALDVKVSAA